MQHHNLALARFAERARCILLFRLCQSFKFTSFMLFPERTKSGAMDPLEGRLPIVFASLEPSLVSAIISFG